ncbi:MAG: hypothetical protein ACK501_20630 [Planctomycetota bacterium]
MNGLRCLVGLVLALFVSSTAVAQTNATVTLSKKGATEITDQEKVVITVKKGANEVDKTEGSHKFPKHTSLSSMAAYYGPILKQNGLTEGTDFTIAENSIHFYGVDKVDGGASSGVDVEGTLDKGKFVDIPGVKLSMTRGASPQFGVVTVLAACVFPGGSSEDGDDAVISLVRSSRVTAYYEAGDSAQTMMAKIAEALTADGWTAAASGSQVVIVSHRGGSPIQSISVRFQHLKSPEGVEPPPATDAEEDHWVLERVAN